MQVPPLLCHGTDRCAMPTRPHGLVFILLSQYLLVQPLPREKERKKKLNSAGPPEQFVEAAAEVAEMVKWRSMHGPAPR